MVSNLVQMVKNDIPFLAPKKPSRMKIKNTENDVLEFITRAKEKFVLK